MSKAEKLRGKLSKLATKVTEAEQQAAEYEAKAT